MEVNKYKISVLIPVYNTEKYLKSCLDSVIKQSLKDIEIICVNDGSSDSSALILNEYQEKYENIKVITCEKNQGLARARYHAINASTGDYIMFLDSDDTLEPNACEVAYKNITEYDVDIVHFGANVITDKYVNKGFHKEAKKFFKAEKFKLSKTEILGDCYVHRRYNWNVWTKIYRAELVKKINKFIPEKRCVMSEDMMIYFFISFYANSFRSIPDKLINYNYGTGVSTSGMNLKSYIAHLEQSVALNGIRDFIKSNNLDTFEWLQNIYLNLKEKTLIDLVAKFVIDVDEKDGGQAFDAFMEHYDVMDFITSLTKINEYSQEQLITKIYNSNFVSQKTKKDIKTIGIFYYRMSNGGIERVVSKIIPLLIKMGYKVVFFTEKISKKLDYKLPKEVIIETLPPSDYVSKEAYLYHAKEFKLCLIRNNVDLVLYQASVALYLANEILICKSLNIPICITTHDWYSSTLLAKDPYMASKRKIYSMCDAVQTITTAEEYTWKEMGVRARYIPNPLTFNLRSAKPSKLDNKDILWVGRLDYRQKCPDQAVEAMKYVVKAIPEAKLHIVGTGEKESDKKYLQKLIKKNNLEGNVILHGFSSQVERYYSACSMLLMTSSYEVYPMVIGEAMSYGLPIVLYDLPYVELLKDANCSLSSPQLNPYLLANNIIKVLSNDKLRHEMGQAARKKIEDVSKFNFVKAWKEFIDDIASGKVERSENNLLAQVMDISYQHVNRSLTRNYFASDHPDNYFNITDKRYILIDTEFVEKDQLYGLLLQDKGKLYRAYFFLMTNPKLFFKKIFMKLFRIDEEKIKAKEKDKLKGKKEKELKLEAKEKEKAKIRREKARAKNKILREKRLQEEKELKEKEKNRDILVG